MRRLKIPQFGAACAYNGALSRKIKTWPRRSWLSARVQLLAVLTKVAERMFGRLQYFAPEFKYLFAEIAAKSAHP